MNPTELLCQIDAVGGVLTATPDDRWNFCSVPTEFYELLKEHKPALIALLIERAKPRPSNLLISSERLKAANERYLQEQAAKAAPAPSAPGVIYGPRTPEQWEKRANQSWQWDSNLSTAETGDAARRTRSRDRRCRARRRG